MTEEVAEDEATPSAEEEATPEVTKETAAEEGATPSAEEEATPKATQEAAAEETPEDEATPSAEEEATLEATEEAAEDEATPSAEEEATPEATEEAAEDEATPSAEGEATPKVTQEAAEEATPSAEEEVAVGEATPAVTATENAAEEEAAVPAAVGTTASASEAPAIESTPEVEEAATPAAEATSTNVASAQSAVVAASTNAPTQRPTPPPTDSQCRGCHGEKQDMLTLTSGEVITLGVDLAVISGSPHSSLSSDHPVRCNDCHRNETRYRYPHVENPAQTRQEFAANVAVNCASCHYPHSPFHDTEQTDYPLPTCVDCHGSHAIDRVENMAHSMPATCLQCHTDETPAWAANFVAPRLGFGAGAEGYAGSTRCAGCHEERFFSWRDTLHGRLIQEIATASDAVVGDFTTENEVRTFALSDAAYTIGSRWKQLYMTQTVSNTFHILPAQWNVATESWVSYHPEDWTERDWRQECGSCHVTGLNTQDWTFTEFGVGCESCHGPSAAHAADPENVKPFDAVDDQVCGACHSRGTSPEGYAFPATYKPGDVLVEHFTFTTTAEAVWPDGSARWNNQQYMDYVLDNEMHQSGEVPCVACHAVHDNGVTEAQLNKPVNELCLDCHAQQEALVKHTPFHEQAVKNNQFLCTDCHMPKMATSATPFDIASHAFSQPNPQASVDHGGVAAMPNACNQCHSDPGETPQWAAQTIAYAKAHTKPVGGVSYGPGPTPTPIPPPTPMASVGEPAITLPEVETGKWIRWGLIALVALVVLLVAAWAYYRIRTRREHNA
ncbi:MAG: hypothetical protein IPK16_31265 [Anaerolineales bacterium]|nr:hypothetical protein [Anaerolineales bacterium]